jgi:hypothetical protein
MAKTVNSGGRHHRQQSLHSRHQQTNVERSQRVDCVIHRLTQQTFGQL